MPGAHGKTRRAGVDAYRFMVKNRLTLTTIFTLFFVANAGCRDCIERNQGYTLDDTCANKNKYKMKVCKISAERGYYPGSAESCFDDTAFIPETVKDSLEDQSESPDVPVVFSKKLAEQIFRLKAAG